MKANYLNLSLGLLFISLNASAQFEGLSSFWFDTLIRKQLIVHKVKSVSETVISKGVSTFNGRYFFNKNGLVTEQCAQNGKQKRTMVYDKKGRMIKRNDYQYQDTSKVEFSLVHTYDEKGRLIKEDRFREIEGKLVPAERWECKFIKDSKGKMSSELTRYENNKQISREYGRDTIIAKDTLSVSYHFRPDTREEGRQAGEMTLYRDFEKDGCFYWETMRGEIFGPAASIREIKSEYFCRNEKGLPTDEGELDFSEVYMDFMQEHPENYNPYVMSPLFIEAYIKGEVKVPQKSNMKWVYDANGRLNERLFGEGSFGRYKYNDKGQLTEIYTEWEGNTSTTLLFYNAKGFVERTLNTTVPSGQFGEESDHAASAEDAKGGEGVKEERETLYTYTF